MPASVTAVRAFLVADAQGHPLPSPQPVDLPTDVIPHGATVRFEVEVASPQPVLPMRASLKPVGRRAWFSLYPKGGGNVFSGQVRLPWGLRWGGGEVEGAKQPPVFPGADSPPIGEGEHGLQVCPYTTDGVALEPGDFSFRLGPRPSPGGAAPRIVSVSTGLADNRVRVGQPWLLTAQVEDADDDVEVVIFSVLQGDLAQWWFLVDDGSCGDAVAGDGVYSFLRVGGDPWDRPELGGGEDVPATLSVQAGDLRGNWSEPVVLEYQILATQPPVWMEQPTPDAPSIVEAGLDPARGPLSLSCLWARCDTLEAWVCGTTAGGERKTFPLYDDGMEADQAAGDGVHVRVALFGPRHRDVIVYAAPKRGPLLIGRKLAVDCSELATY